MSLLAITALCAPSASARGACPDEQSTFLTATPALRASVLCLVNETRLQRGLPALHRDSRLETAAQLHTDDMVANDYFDHPSQNGTTPAQRMTSAGYLWSPAGTVTENIATGVSTPRAVVDLWLVDADNSPPGHCRAILEPGLRDLGVGINPGIALVPFVGVWTQDFGRLSTASAPSANTGPRDGCPYALAQVAGGPTPTATTSAATGITSSSATVNGTVNANAGGFTSYHVEYGTTTSYGSQTHERVAGSIGATVTETLSGLAAGTHHFRVVAMNHNGETRSADRVVTTTGSPAKPLVTTSAPTTVTAGSATLNASVNPAGKATSYRFEYGTTTSYGSSTAITAAGSDTTTQAVTASLSAMTPGTTYHARIVAANADGTAYGDDVSFTTLAAPTIGTGQVDAGQTTATFYGYVDPNGKPTTFHFEYGPTVSYGLSTPVASAGSGIIPQAVSAAVSDLTRGTSYHVRLVATNSDGIVNGQDVSFTTLDPPTVMTGAAVTGATAATLHGSVDPNGRAAAYRFDFGTTTSYGSSTTATSAGSGDAAQAVSATVVGLTAQTTYHVRIVAASADGTTLGEDVTFTTTAPPPAPPPTPPPASPVTGSATVVASAPRPPAPMAPFAPPPATSAAVVTGLRITPSRFRAAKSGASVSSAAIRARTRTQVRYTLSAPAIVRIAAERAGQGRRAGRNCVPATRANRSRAPCTRYTNIRGTFARSRAAGLDRFTFSGRIGGRALRPGAYRLLVMPAGGTTARAAFRVILPV